MPLSQRSRCWPAPARAQTDKLVVAIGTAPPDLSLQTYYFALENGFYKQEGLDVTLVPFNGDATAIRAMVSGDADIAAGVGLAIPLRAVEAGSKLKIFLATSPKMDYLLVAQKDIANVKQFAGKTIGISGPGAVSYQVPLLMIKLAGGDPTKVKFINVGGSSARTLALIGKKIDGGVLNSSFASRTTKYDYLHVIGDAANDLPNFIYTVEVATERTIEEKQRPCRHSPLERCAARSGRSTTPRRQWRSARRFFRMSPRTKSRPDSRILRRSGTTT